MSLSYRVQMRHLPNPCEIGPLSEFIFAIEWFAVPCINEMVTLTKGFSESLSFAFQSRDNLDSSSVTEPAVPVDKR